MSLGMGEDITNAVCSGCTQDDEKFYYPRESVEKGQTVVGKEFEGIVRYIGVETEVEITESQIYTIGESIHIDKSFIRPVEQTET